MSEGAIAAAIKSVTPKAYWRGTHRTCSPEETLEKFGRFKTKIGITRIADVTGLDRLGLPVCVAIRPNARSLATSQGKGETLAAATVSAMMESMELWHAEHIELPVRYEAYHALPEDERVPDPAQLPVRVDASFDLDCPVQWIKGYDLLRQTSCWVPYELVSINLVRQPSAAPIFLESTNGLSSGNHRSEAIVHGICEVIERDAIALWELHPHAERKARQLDLATVGDDVIAGRLADLKSLGILVAAWDVTSDVDIPTFTAAIMEDRESEQWRPIPPYFGHGAHLDPVVALSRALHEAIQSRLTFISGSRDDMFGADYVRAGNRDDHDRMRTELVVPPPKLAFRSGGYPVGDNCQADIATLLTVLQRVGVDSVVAIDLTHEEIGLPVVKIIIPALEPYLTALYRPGARAHALRKTFEA